MHCLVVNHLYYRIEDDSASEDGETNAEIALPEENGERHMKPVRMLKFSGIYLIHLNSCMLMLFSNVI